MGTPKLSLITEGKIVAFLLLGKSRKEVARLCKVSLSSVAKTKANYPLFFWKTKRRYLR